MEGGCGRDDEVHGVACMVWAGRTRLETPPRPTLLMCDTMRASSGAIVNPAPDLLKATLVEGSIQRVAPLWGSRSAMWHDSGAACSFGKPSGRAGA